MNLPNMKTEMVLLTVRPLLTEDLDVILQSEDEKYDLKKTESSTLLRTGTFDREE